MKTIWYMVRQYWKYAEGRRALVVVTAALNFVAFSFWISEPIIFAQILNTLQVGERDTMLAGITRWILLWVGAYVAFNVLFRIAVYIENVLAYRAKQNFIAKTYGVVSNLPLAWHADHHSGDTINRVNMAASSLEEFIERQHSYIDSLVSAVGPMVALAFLRWDIAAIAFAVTVISISIIALFDRRIVRYYKVTNDIKHRVSAALYDFIGNIRTIVILRLGAKTRRDLNDRLEEGFRPTVWVNGVVSQGKWLFLNFSVLLLQVGIVFYYIYRQLSSGSRVLIGNVSAVFQYLGQISFTFFRTADEYQKIMRMKANMEAVEPILSAVVGEAKPARMKRNWGAIEIRGLNFSYGSKDASLKGVDLKIRRGASIALVGESGSGKSTLMSLLRGLHSAPDCRVFVDGAENRRGLASLAGITTLMPQDPEIFENTIGYNITMGLDYPKALVERMIGLA
ncbi:MAG: ABC transporter ATP-binding protein/permease, partial [Rickettsiales bacterium]|nr:ABC transporter ATP-binding protein/permease [Rickettsiales bacterium]